MKNPPLILITDDDKDFRELLATKFRASGLQVELAENGEQGVTKAKELAPDLILMDVKMPVMNGIEALLKLKESKETHNIRVVLLTAFGDPQQEIYSNDERFAQELGAHEYLLKTQDLEEIVKKVKSFVGK